MVDAHLAARSGAGQRAPGGGAPLGRGRSAHPERACADDIAGRAGVSKAAVHDHYEDRQALFTAGLRSRADALEAAVDRVPPASTGELEHGLRAPGEHLVRLMPSPAVAGLHEVSAADVSRFPDLVRALHERGVTRSRTILARFLEARGARGELEIDDPGLAAMQLLLLRSADLELRVELGLQQAVSEEKIGRAAAQAAETFLRAHRPRPERRARCATRPGWAGTRSERRPPGRKRASLAA